MPDSQTPQIKSLQLSDLRWALTPISTTTALRLARHWHDTGAAGSWGDAALMIAISAGAGVAGASLSSGTGDSGAAVPAFMIAGAVGSMEVCAYTNNTTLPWIMWLIANVLGLYATSRTSRRTREGREVRATALQQTEMITSTQRYTVDRQSETARYVVDRQSETARYVADSRERTARHVVDSQERTIKYVADKHPAAAASLAEAQWLRARGLDQHAEPSVYSVAAAAEESPRVVVPDFVPEDFDARPETSKTDQGRA